MPKDSLLLVNVSVNWLIPWVGKCFGTVPPSGGGLPTSSLLPAGDPLPPLSLRFGAVFQKLDLEVKYLIYKKVQLDARYHDNSTRNPGLLIGTVDIRKVDIETRSRNSVSSGPKVVRLGP